MASFVHIRLGPLNLNGSPYNLVRETSLLFLVAPHNRSDWEHNGLCLLGWGPLIWINHLRGAQHVVSLLDHTISNEKRGSIAGWWNGRGLVVRLLIRSRIRGRTGRSGSKERRGLNSFRFHNLGRYSWSSSRAVLVLLSESSNRNRISSLASLHGPTWKRSLGVTSIAWFVSPCKPHRAGP